MKAVTLTRSGWWNDQVNGDTGRPLVLDDAMAQDVVETWHIAVYDPKRQAELDSTAPVTPQQEEAMQQLVELSEELDLYGLTHAEVTEKLDDLVAARPALPAVPESLGEPQPQELKRPRIIAPKADWINWAVNGNHGQLRPTAGEAAQLSKHQLVSRYGETF